MRSESDVRKSLLATLAIALLAMAGGGAGSAAAEARSFRAAHPTVGEQGDPCEFLDVRDPTFAVSMEQVCRANAMAPCGPSYFCPGELVIREEMAVHLIKLLEGADFEPPGVVGQSSFIDVPAHHCLAPWIEVLYAEGITAGCGFDSQGRRLYCPTASVSRWQMAVFLAIVISKRAKESIPVSGFAHGSFYNCVSGGVSLFGDVPPGDPGCRHVHYIYARGVTAGCGPGLFCPSQPVPREQMAAFMCNGFDELGPCS